MGAARSAFEDVVPGLLPRARSVAGRMLANPDLAEEAVQEALLRAFRFWAARRDSEAWPWLRRLVVRECLRASSRDAAAQRGAPADAPLDTPEDVVLRREEHEEVRRAVERLPDGYRRVLMLHHRHGLAEAEVAAVLGLPAGTVKWRAKRAHDHLRQVLNRRPTRPLAETLREVTKEMSLEIGLSVGRLPAPTPDPPDWPDPPAAHEEPEPLVTLAEAQADVPEFVVPQSMVRPSRTARVMRNRDGSPRGVQYDVDGGGFAGAPDGFTVTRLHVRERTVGMHFVLPSARQVIFNEPTRVGEHDGRWWRVDDGQCVYQTVAWRAAGGLWMVRSLRPAAELRGMAEAIAALQPAEAEAPPPEPPPARPAPTFVTAAEARAALPGFTLDDGFLDRHEAKIVLCHRSGAAAPDGVQVYTRDFVVWYLAPGSAPLRIQGFEIEDDHTPLGGRTGTIWWKSPDRPAVSWRAADGGRWRVGGRLQPAELRRAAEDVAAAAP